MIQKIARVLLGILLLAFFAMCISSCSSTNRKILIEVRAVKAQMSRLDSTYRSNQTILNEYEKSKIKTQIKSMPTDSLLQYIRSNR